MFGHNDCKKLEIEKTTKFCDKTCGRTGLPPSKKKQQTKINTVHPPKYVWIWNDLESSQTRDLYFRINNPTNFRSSGLPPKEHPLPPPPKKKHKKSNQTNKKHPPFFEILPPSLFPPKPPHISTFLCGSAQGHENFFTQAGTKNMFHVTP